MAKAKKRDGKKSKGSKKKAKKSKTAKPKTAARRPTEKGFWATFFGAFAGPSSGKGT